MAVLLVAPLAIVMSKALGLYDRDQYVVRRTTVDEIPSILQLSTFYALFVWLSESVLLRGYLTRRRCSRCWARTSPCSWSGGPCPGSRCGPRPRRSAASWSDPRTTARRTARKLTGSPGSR